MAEAVVVEEALVVVAEVVAAADAEVVVVVEDVAEAEKNVMKKIIIHSVPVVISLIWLMAEHKTYHPIFMKGPDFLKFYIILLTGIYLSVFMLKFVKESVSKTTFYFLILIFIIGVIKLIRGLHLGKPVGYLVIILIIEIAVIFIVKSFQFNKKFK